MLTKMLNTALNTEARAGCWLLAAGVGLAAMPAPTKRLLFALTRLAVRMVV